MGGRRLICLDVDGTIWSGGGPITQTYLAELQAAGTQVVVVSPSENFPRGPDGGPLYPRIVSRQLAGNPRSADLLAARAAYPDAQDPTYVDNLDSGKLDAEAAGFQFERADRFAALAEMEFVADHNHSQACIYLDRDGRWHDHATGAPVGDTLPLEEFLPVDATPRGPVPYSLWISTFARYADDVPTGMVLTWREVVDRFSRHDRRAILGDDVPLWNAAMYAAGGRHRPGPASPNDIVSASMALLDCDGIRPSRIHDALGARGLAHLTVSSYHHQEGHPHLRVVVPLVRPIPLDLWPSVAQATAWILGGVACPPEEVDLARWYYTPVAPPGANTVVVKGGGEALDWTKLPDVRPLLQSPTIPTPWVWRRRARTQA